MEKKKYAGTSLITAGVFFAFTPLCKLYLFQESKFSEKLAHHPTYLFIYWIVTLQPLQYT